MENTVIEVVLQSWVRLLFASIACAMVCTGIEVAFKLDRSFYSRVRGVFFTSIYLFGLSLVGVLIQLTVGGLGIKPLVSIEFFEGNDALNWLLLIPISLLPSLIGDFGFYCAHRLQHAIPFLWRFHQVHHAIEELNSANNYHHWSEGLVQGFFNVLPAALLIEWKDQELFVFALWIGSFWGHLIHLKSEAGFGPLGRVLVGPGFHRVHHSRAAQHFDKNFAGMFSLLDVIFGTAYFPAKGEVTETGLNEKLEARTAVQYLVALRDRN